MPAAPAGPAVIDGDHREQAGASVPVTGTGKAELLEAARTADRTWQQERKTYLKRMVPKISNRYLPLVSVLGTLALVCASLFAEELAPALLRSLGVSETLGTGWASGLFVFSVSAALMALGILGNLLISNRLSRWERTLRQELDTHEPDEPGPSADYRSIDNVDRKRQANR